MSVYNGEKTLKFAIESILQQSFEDFEFIIINDGSTDSTEEIIQSYKKQDPRIKYFSQENIGLTPSLNRGISMAKSTYIARQDADDISYKNRFSEQIKVMSSNPDLVLLGSSADIQYPGFKKDWGFFEQEKLNKIVFMQPPFPHSSVMFRKDIAQKLHGYDESYKTAQDMELWMRFAQEGKIGMIDKKLVQITIERESISQKRKFRQFRDAWRARIKHNTLLSLPLVCYHALRSLLISLMPHIVIEHVRDIRDAKIRKL